MLVREVLFARVGRGLAHAVLALGPELTIGGPTGVPAPYALLAELPGFRGLRAPVRWFAVAAMAMAVGAAAGAQWLGRHHRLALPAVLLVTVVELLMTALKVQVCSPTTLPL